MSPPRTPKGPKGPPDEKVQSALLFMSGLQDAFVPALASASAKQIKDLALCIPRFTHVLEEELGQTPFTWPTTRKRLKLCAQHIDNVNLSVRTDSVLRYNHKLTIGQIARSSELVLQTLRGPSNSRLSKKNLSEIKNLLSGMGLRLDMPYKAGSAEIATFEKAIGNLHIHHAVPIGTDDEAWISHLRESGYNDINSVIRATVEKVAGEMTIKRGTAQNLAVEDFQPIADNIARLLGKIHT